MLDVLESKLSEDTDMQKWQENFDDDEINDQFEHILKKELDSNKVASK